MPMGFITIMVQGIKAIVTKNIIGTVASIIINTMVGITDRINTMVDIIDMVIISIGIIDHTSILILVDINATLVIDIGAMGASKVSLNVVADRKGLRYGI